MPYGTNSLAWVAGRSTREVPCPFSQCCLLPPLAEVRDAMLNDCGRKSDGECRLVTENLHASPPLDFPSPKP